MKLGDFLKQKRESHGFSLRQLEQKLKFKDVSYSHTNIKRLEDNELDKAPVKVISALAEIYNTDKIALFNMAGAQLNNDYETKEEKTSFEKALDLVDKYFGDETISLTDKKRLFEQLQDIYFETKIKNRLK